MATSSAAKEQLREHLDRIETLLGYLRGNENAWQYLHLEAQFEQYSGGPTTTLKLEADYVFPCPESAYAVQPHWTPTFELPPGGTLDNQKFARDVQDQLDIAWRDGATWAAGVSGYAYSVAAQFMNPEPLDMSRAAQGTMNDALALQVPEGGEWANLGSLQEHWNGLGATEFDNFYENLSGAVAAQGYFASLVAVGFAEASLFIARTQQGAVKFAETLQEALDATAVAWVNDGMTPTNPSSWDPSWVADVEAIAKDAFEIGLGLIPGGGDIAKGYELLSAKAQQYTALIHDVAHATSTGLPELDSNVSIVTAEEGYHQLVNTLRDSYRSQYEQAFDRLDAGTTATSPGSASALQKQAFSASNILDLLEDRRGGKRYPWGIPADVPSGSVHAAGDKY